MLDNLYFSFIFLRSISRFQSSFHYYRRKHKKDRSILFSLIHPIRYRKHYYLTQKIILNGSNKRKRKTQIYIYVDDLFQLNKWHNIPYISSQNSTQDLIEIQRYYSIVHRCRPRCSSYWCDACTTNKWQNKKDEKKRKTQTRENTIK